jgi:ABC-2 type transport system ATP-binding protein
VRQLIKSLALTHTVLISTHILPEAEMTCNRMVIMFEGKILAADTPENLQQLMSSNSQVLAEIAAPLAELQKSWAEMPEIEHFDVSAAEGEYFRCALTPRNGLDLRPRIFALARERGWTLRELTRNRHSLEDIYVRVTRPEGEEEG